MSNDDTAGPAGIATTPTPALDLEAQINASLKELGTEAAAAACGPLIEDLNLAITAERECRKAPDWGVLSWNTRKRRVAERLADLRRARNRAEVVADVEAKIKEASERVQADIDQVLYDPPALDREEAEGYLTELLDEVLAGSADHVPPPPAEQAAAAPSTGEAYDHCPGACHDACRCVCEECAARRPTEARENCGASSGPNPATPPTRAQRLAEMDRRELREAFRALRQIASAAGIVHPRRYFIIKDGIAKLAEDTLQLIGDQRRAELEAAATMLEQNGQSTAAMLVRYRAAGPAAPVLAVRRAEEEAEEAIETAFWQFDAYRKQAGTTMPERDAFKLAVRPLRAVFAEAYRAPGSSPFAQALEAELAAGQESNRIRELEECDARAGAKVRALAKEVEAVRERNDQLARRAADLEAELARSRKALEDMSSVARLSVDERFEERATVAKLREEVRGLQKEVLEVTFAGRTEAEGLRRAIAAGNHQLELALGDRRAQVAIVFDGPPGPEAGRFVEFEINGRSVRVGEWVQAERGLWCLTFPLGALITLVAKERSIEADEVMASMEAELEGKGGDRG